MLGDGTLVRDSGNPYMQFIMKNKKFLESLSEKLEIHSTDISVFRTKEESIEHWPEDHYSDNPNPSTLYKLQTRRSEKLSRFDWYSNGNKEIPNKISLTPTTVKYWYICDGDLKNGSNARIAIMGFKDSQKVKRLFNNIGLEPSVHSEGRLYFNLDNSKQFFEFIGKPVEGFKYKWPEKYR